MTEPKILKNQKLSKML